jgi:uncharacterized protein with LGFP repeats
MRARELKEGACTQTSNSNSGSNVHRAINAAASAAGVVGHVYGIRSKGMSWTKAGLRAEGA